MDDNCNDKGDTVYRLNACNWTACKTSHSQPPEHFPETLTVYKCDDRILSSFRNRKK